MNNKDKKMYISLFEIKGFLSELQEHIKAGDVPRKDIIAAIDLWIKDAEDETNYDTIDGLTRIGDDNGKISNKESSIV